MLENKSFIKIKKSNERNFGLVFGTFFIIISLYPLLKNEDVRIWALLISIIFYFLSFFLPKSLIILNNIWFRIGIFLGKIIAPLVMSFIYIFVVTPTGIVMKLINHNYFKYKFDRSLKSYWIKRKETSNSMKNQF